MLGMTKAAIILMGRAASLPAATVTTLIGDGTRAFRDPGEQSLRRRDWSRWGAVFLRSGQPAGPAGGSDHQASELSTIAGNGQHGYRGDGGPAVEASLSAPHELTFDANGDPYFAERGNQSFASSTGKPSS